MNQVLCHVKGIQYEDFSEQEEMVEDNRKFTIGHHLASLSEFHMSGGRFAKLISECKQANPVNELLQLHITWTTSKMENAAKCREHGIQMKQTDAFQATENIPPKENAKNH
jgi:hypothetical protein